MFKRIGSLIRTLPARSKTPDTIVALQVRQVASDCLRRILKSYPQEVEKKIKIGVFKNGMLVILAPSTIAVELHMRSGDLIDDVNSKIGRKVVRGIRFKAS